jgi:AcrR family transcriptional regulator
MSDHLGGAHVRPGGVARGLGGRDRDEARTRREVPSCAERFGREFDFLGGQRIEHVDVASGWDHLSGNGDSSSANLATVKVDRGARPVSRAPGPPAAENGDERRRPGYREGRDALLDATVRVVAKHGLRGLTYRRVAEEAGTTHGLVSYHFKSRDALIHEAVAKASRAAVDRSLLNPPTHRVEDFVRDLPELVAHEADAQAFQFELAIEGRRRPNVSAEMRAAYEEWLAITRDSLAHLGLTVDVSVAARLAFAAIDGLTLQQLIFEDPRQTREAVELLQDLLGMLVERNGGGAAAAGAGA